ncbi:MAG: hypothetical protein MJ171_06030 [Clostridia bacterium]|nr:hypothetical protein [Clostridia bacterium]
MSFEVIKGGLLEDSTTSIKVFISAHATDTRLMGVTAVHAVWFLPDNDHKRILHQFFYFDSEEFGFDTYKSVLAESLYDAEANEQVKEISDKMMGCLGGKQVEITERELRALVTYYERFTKEHDDIMPEGREEYGFLLENPVELSDPELEKLYDRICEDITCDYQVINYFLMRVAGKDLRVARHISGPGIVMNVLSMIEPAALLRNVISEEITQTMTVDNLESYFNTFTTRRKYMTESLLEAGGLYFLLLSEITVENLKIKSFRKINFFKVSGIEADLITKRPEHITLYETILPPELLLNFDTPLLENSMANDHDNGTVYMIFNRTNDHVKERVFNISNDVLGVYYISSFGEVLVMSSTEEGMEILNEDLKNARIYEYLERTGVYEFDAPVLYSFVESEYPDFAEFIEDFEEENE